MATVIESSPDRLYHPLDRLRRKIRRYVIVDGLLLAALFLMGWFWVGLLVDFGLFKLTGFDWVQDAPRALRGAALLTMIGCVGLILGLRVVRRMAREFSYPALALVLEKRFPTLLQDRLITAVELADVSRAAGYGYSISLIHETMSEARAAVDQVPVSDVFNWQRLRLKAWLLVGCLLCGWGLSYVYFAASARTTSFVDFAWRFSDTAVIWGERNLLLRNVPWPRQAYLELVGFPGEEMRIGRDAPAPTVRVKAYQWVIADETTRDGWRPLRWSDVNQLSPDLNILGFDGKEWPQEPRYNGAALVETADGSPPARVKDVVDALEKLVLSPRMARTLRKLDIPADVTLHYRGEKTSGTLGLTREPSGEFSAEVTGLKESVRFVVRGADFATTPRQITLVPPPALIRLTRTEAQPAYLYHSAPVDGTLTDLKGLRQVFPDKDVSLTGEKSVIPAVPAGTDLVLTGTADKPLKAVLLTLKQGSAPGVEVGNTVPLPVSGDTFTVSLTGDYRVTRPVEFDLTLVDLDEVTSHRSILIQVTEDQPPQVEVAVDILRKQGNQYLCTPIAMIPFLSESIVRDDVGLSRVEFEYVVRPVAADPLMMLQAQAIASLWAFPPVLPSVGGAIGPSVSITLATALVPSGPQLSGRVTVPRFADDIASVPKTTYASLKQQLSQPVDAERSLLVRQVKFSDPLRDVFDLERALPSLRSQEASEIQPRYRIDLAVVAADVNVETGPKIGTNLEPIRLLVISEQDLLAELSKDEENLIVKLDDIIKKVRSAQAKLADMSDSLAPASPAPTVIVAAAVRGLDVIQDVEKGRDDSLTLIAEYRRLRRELEVNRCNRAVGERIDTNILKPMDSLIQREFVTANADLTAVQKRLADGRRPDNDALSQARQSLANLLDALSRVRADLGEAVNLNKLRDNLRQIIERQQIVAKALQSLAESYTKALFAPSIKPVAPIELERGQSKTITHAIDWNVYEGGDLKIRFESPAGIRAPAELTVTDEKDEFEYEITAGDTAGEYTLKLLPAVGKPVEVKVLVK